MLQMVDRHNSWPPDFNRLRESVFGVYFLLWRLLHFINSTRRETEGLKVLMEEP